MQLAQKLYLFTITHLFPSAILSLDDEMCGEEFSCQGDVTFYGKHAGGGDLYVLEEDSTSH